MILGRITRAIREQNWFAVAIEFVIVIAGVVIGFQVTEWNAERQEQERREEAMIEARSALVEAVRMHNIFAGYVRPQLRQSAAFCALLAERTGDPCLAAPGD